MSQVLAVLWGWVLVFLPFVVLSSLERSDQTAPNQTAPTGDKILGRISLSSVRGFGRSPMGCVYLATNRVNGKKYVGQSRSCLHDRIRHHRHSAKYGSLLAFHCALRKYGFDGFIWEVLFESDRRELLDFVEISQIQELGTLSPAGYNLRPGGNAFSADCWEVAEFRERHSKACKDAQNREDTVRKKSVAQKKAMAKPEVRARLIAAVNTESARKKKIASLKLYSLLPGIKEKRSRASKQAHAKPEMQAKRRRPRGPYRNRGKSYEEMYGAERAKQERLKRTRAGGRGPKNRE
jgi:hypothetical protein